MVNRYLFVIESVLKTDPWTYETKDWNGEKNKMLSQKGIVAE